MFEFLKSWSTESWHASEEDLMLYADGELSPRKVVRLRAHLEHCWQCRVRAEKNEQIISNLVDFLNRGFTPRLPSPPNSWRGFDAKLRRAMDDGDRRPRIARVISSLRQSLPTLHASLRFASGLAVVLVGLLILSRFQVVPTGSASL